MRAGLAPESRIWPMTNINFPSPFEGVVFALHGDKELVGGGEGVGHEDAEGGRAIEDGEVEGVFVAQGLQGAAELLEVVVHAGHFDFEAGEIDVRGDEGEVFDARGGDGGANVIRAGERAVEGGRVFDFGGHGAGGVALRVEVDEEDALAARGEAGGEIDGGRGFADAAFLVGHREDFHGAECLTTDITDGTDGFFDR